VRATHATRRFALAVLVVAVALGVAQTAPGRSLLKGAGLTAPPERYTELYFTTPDELPAASRSGTVSFTVRNDEGAPRNYHWTLRVAGNVQDSGQVTVRPQRTAKVRRVVHVSCGARVRVEVALTTPSQSIGYWARCSR
jgi:hypothetical protein